MNWFRISLVILFAVVVLWLGDFFMDVGLAAKDHCLIWSKGTTAVCTIGFIPKGVETVIHRRTLLHMFVGEIQVDNFSPQVLQSVLILLSALGFSSLLLWRSLQYIKAIRRDFRYESTPTSKLTHEPNDEPTEHASVPPLKPKHEISPIFVLFLLILIMAAIALNEFFKRSLLD